MNVSIQPRKTTDRGGFACMPLKQNVPVGHDDWKLTTCPECGEECWETPLLQTVKEQGAIALCTVCALTKGANR